MKELEPPKPKGMSMTEVRDLPVKDRIIRLNVDKKALLVSCRSKLSEAKYAYLSAILDTISDPNANLNSFLFCWVTLIEEFWMFLPVDLSVVIIVPNKAVGEVSDNNTVGLLSYIFTTDLDTKNQLELITKPDTCGDIVLELLWWYNTGGVASPKLQLPE